jgi:tight adherence protein B
MSSLATAYLILLASGVIAVLGVRQLVIARAEREEIADRARFEPAPRRRTRVREAFDRRLRRSALGERLHQRLLSAGLGTRPIDFLAVLVAVFVGALVLGWALLPWPLALLLAAGAVRGVIAWLDHKRAQRREEFVGALPELARVLSNAVSAGLSTTAALEVASRELRGPVGAEIQLVVGEIRLGQSLPEALRNLQRRVPSRELGVLVSTMVIQQRAGGDIVRALGQMSDTLEARKDMIREVRTVMAGSVFSGWLVAGLGLGTVVLLNTLRPGVLDEMISSVVGIAALIFAGTLYAIGLVLIRRVTRVEI